MTPRRILNRYRRQFGRRAADHLANYDPGAIAILPPPELTVQQLRYLARLVLHDATAAAALDDWPRHQLATDTAEIIHAQIAARR